jgi:hypothetical protein
MVSYIDILFCDLTSLRRMRGLLWFGVHLFLKYVLCDFASHWCWCLLNIKILVAQLISSMDTTLHKSYNVCC